MCSQKFRKKKIHFFLETNRTKYVLQLYIHDYILWFWYAFRVCIKSMSEMQYIHAVIVVVAGITQNVWRWDKTFIRNRWPVKVFLGPPSKYLPVHSLQSLWQPTKIYHRSSGHSKNTWNFLHPFLRSMICRNQIEGTLYPYLWVSERFCCKIFIQNGGLVPGKSLTL